MTAAGGRAAGGTGMADCGSGGDGAVADDGLGPLTTGGAGTTGGVRWERFQPTMTAPSTPPASSA